MGKQYEIRQFSEIPQKLRDKVKDLHGNIVDISDRALVPNSRIVIEISPNPGVTPYLLKPEERFYDFFAMKCKEAEVSPQDISERLAEKFFK